MLSNNMKMPANYETTLKSNDLISLTNSLQNLKENTKLKNRKSKKNSNSRVLNINNINNRNNVRKYN